MYVRTLMPISISMQRCGHGNGSGQVASQVQSAPSSGVWGQDRIPLPGKFLTFRVSELVAHIL